MFIASFVAGLLYSIYIGTTTTYFVTASINRQVITACLSFPLKKSVAGRTGEGGEKKKFVIYVMFVIGAQSLFRISPNL